MRRELVALEAEAAVQLGRVVWDASQRRDNAAASCCFERLSSARRVSASESL